MPLYWRDWLTGESTSAMTAEQEGAFLNLLLRAWGSDPPCTLPNDTKLLAKWSKLGRKWQMNSTLLLARFDVLADGRLQNRKQYAVFQELVAHREKKSAAGRKGMARRWGQRTPNDNNDITPLLHRYNTDTDVLLTKPYPASASASVTDVTDTSYPSGAATPGVDNTVITPLQPEKPPKKKRVRKPRPRKSAAEPQEPAWTSTAGETWQRLQGGRMSYGRIGSALKLLITEHGEQEVLDLWDRYLVAMVAAGKSGMATPEHFASRYGQVKAKGAVPLIANGTNGRKRTTDVQDYGDVAAHNAKLWDEHGNPRGEWK